MNSMQRPRAALMMMFAASLVASQGVENFATTGPGYDAAAGLAQRAQVLRDLANGPPQPELANHQPELFVYACLCWLHAAPQSTACAWEARARSGPSCALRGARASSSALMAAACVSR